MNRPDWASIREHYRRNTTRIYAGGRNNWGIDAYAWDHQAGITLTPIEQWLWHDIRQCNAILYPQYPVAGYFVDFGNPVARVAIECDGKAFHTDKARDERRQREIEANGWTVYRFTGSECRLDSREEEDETGATVWVQSETLARMRQIVERHGIQYVGRSIDDDDEFSDVPSMAEVSFNWLVNFTEKCRNAGGRNA